MSFSSFRTRLLVTVIGTTVVAVVVGGWMAYVVTSRHLYHEFDHFLADKLRFHSKTSVQRGKRISFAMSKAAFERIHDPEDPEFFQYRFLDGRTIFKSYSLPESDLPLVGLGSTEPAVMDFVLPSGKPGRCMGFTYVPVNREEGDVPTEVHLVVAHERHEMVGALDELLRLILGAGGAAIVLLSAASVLVVRYVVRPLDELAGKIESVPLEAMSERFALEGAPSELQPVVGRLNELMERVERAIAREREFAANAAHELRNPLAGLRSQLELALSKKREAEADTDTLRSALETQGQMQMAVENLLVLARLDGGGRVREVEAVEIPPMLKRCWKPLFEAASQRRLKVVWKVDRAMPEVVTSADLLRILVSNVMDNAVSYTPEGGRVEIVAGCDDGNFKLVVANTNPGVVEGDVPELMARYKRGEEEKRGDRPHAGIGLSLCSRIAETLGGELRVGVTGDRFEIEFSVPVGKYSGKGPGV